MPGWAAALVELALCGWLTLLIVTFRQDAGHHPPLGEVLGWYLLVVILWIIWGP